MKATQAWRNISPYFPLFIDIFSLFFLPAKEKTMKLSTYPPSILILLLFFTYPTLKEKKERNGKTLPCNLYFSYNINIQKGAY